MATTTPDDEFEGRKHVGQDAREIVETLARTSREVLVGPVRSVRAVVLAVLVGVALTFAPLPISSIGVAAVLLLLAHDMRGKA